MGTSKFSPYSLTALRIMTGLLFIQHGMQKLFHFPPGGHHPGPFELFTLAGLGGVLEFFGGLMIVVGLFTRSVAFILSGQMAFAYFFFHLKAGLSMPAGFFPVVNQGDLAILFCFVFFYFAFAGPGAYSLDGWHKHRRM